MQGPGDGHSGTRAGFCLNLQLTQRRGTQRKEKRKSAMNPADTIRLVPQDPEGSQQTEASSTTGHGCPEPCLPVLSSSEALPIHARNRSPCTPCGADLPHIAHGQAFILSKQQPKSDSPPTGELSDLSLAFPSLLRECRGHDNVHPLLSHSLALVQLPTPQHHPRDWTGMGGAWDTLGAQEEAAWKDC